MSISEFFSMGGYGAYVWVSFGATLLLMTTEILLVRSRRRAVVKRLRRLLRAGRPS